MADHALDSPPITRYTKAIVSILAAALVVLGAALTDNDVSTLELTNIGIAVVTAIGVYLVPNLPTGARRYAKGVVAFVGAGLAAVVTVLAEGVTPSEWILVILAALGAIGVVVLPNQTDLAA
jgi:hypothetical protein